MCDILVTRRGFGWKHPGRASDASARANFSFERAAELRKLVSNLKRNEAGALFKQIIRLCKSQLCLLNRTPRPFASRRRRSCEVPTPTPILTVRAIRKRTDPPRTCTASSRTKLYTIESFCAGADTVARKQEENPAVSRHSIFRQLSAASHVIVHYGGFKATL